MVYLFLLVDSWTINAAFVVAIRIHSYHLQSFFCFRQIPRKLRNCHNRHSQTSNLVRGLPDLSRGLLEVHSRSEPFLRSHWSTLITYFPRHVQGMAMCFWSVPLQPRTRQDVSRSPPEITNQTTHIRIFRRPSVTILVRWTLWSLCFL